VDNTIIFIFMPVLKIQKPNMPFLPESKVIRSFFSSRDASLNEDRAKVVARLSKLPAENEAALDRSLLR
jgi:hypothetical protein